MKKRFLAAVLALVMTAACLTACGGENKTEDKQQTTTTTTEETTTATEKETGVIDTTTTTKVTTTRSKMGFASEVPQDLNPGAWLEDSETTTTTTTTKAATTTKPKTTTTKAKTTTKPKATTTKATTTKAKVSTTNGYWHEDPGITKADLKAAAEAAFAKVKKTAKEYGWTISKTFVNRSTDTQYGIHYKVDIFKAADRDMQLSVGTIKAETDGKSIIVKDSALEYGRDGQTDTNYDHFCYDVPLEDTLVYLKENGVKKKQ